MLRLYHLPNSRSSRVHWLLEEAGVPYELVPVSRDEKASDVYRRQHHPLGRVPVLETDGGALFETAAICLYIAELNPDAGLLPAAGTFDRALVYQWVSLALSEIEPYVAESWRLREHDPDRAEAARERARTATLVVDAALAGREFLVGNRFGVADVLCGGALFTARRFASIKGTVLVETYLQRLEDRPARARAYPAAA